MLIDALILMDTATRGRVYFVSLNQIETFSSMHGLFSALRRGALEERRTLFHVPEQIYPDKGKLHTIRISIVAHDHVGVHGFFRKADKYIAFKSNAELLKLIQRELASAMRKKAKPTQKNTANIDD